MFETSHLHPMLVHFPIALTMVGVVLELFRFFFPMKLSKPLCGELLLYFATISAVFAWLTGLLFTSSFSGTSLEVRNTHQLLAILSTALLVIASLFYLLDRFGKRKRKIFLTVGLAFYVLSALLIAATGYVGGDLVYTYMIGL